MSGRVPSTPRVRTPVGALRSQLYAATRQQRNLQPLPPNVITTSNALGALIGFSYQNTWGDFGSPWSPSGYYKDALGIVHFVGLITKAAQTGSWVPNEAMGACPASSLNQVFLCAASSNGGASFEPVQVHVNTNGTFTLGAYGGPANPVQYVSLSGITYRPA